MNRIYCGSDVSGVVYKYLALIPSGSVNLSSYSQPSSGDFKRPYYNAGYTKYGVLDITSYFSDMPTTALFGRLYCNTVNNSIVRSGGYPATIELEVDTDNSTVKLYFFGRSAVSSISWTRIEVWE